MLWLIVVASTALAQDPAPPQSHQGIWVHYEGGPAFLFGHAFYDGQHVDLGAISVEHVLDVGFCPVPELVVHGELRITQPVTAAVEAGTWSASGLEHVDADENGMGAGVLWYGYGNFFAGGSVRYDAARLGDDRTGIDAVNGLAWRGRLGWEGWITDQVGLGAVFSTSTFEPFGTGQNWDAYPLRMVSLDLSVSWG